MDVAWELADGGAAHGTAVQAGTQTAGRGRFGRRGLSSPGESVRLSVVLRSAGGYIGPLLPAVVTLAVCDAAVELAGIACAIKWPNDVHVAGRKLCGVLVEVRVDTAGSAVAVAGVGLNLADVVHPELAGHATSLSAETGRNFRLSDAAEQLLASLDKNLEEANQGADIIGRWRSGLDTLGRRVSVKSRSGTFTGTAEDVDDEGRLLLRTDDGTIHVLSEGDVSIGT